MPHARDIVPDAVEGRNSNGEWGARSHYSLRWICISLPNRISYLCRLGLGVLFLSPRVGIYPAHVL